MSIGRSGEFVWVGKVFSVYGMVVTQERPIGGCVWINKTSGVILWVYLIGL